MADTGFGAEFPSTTSHGGTTSGKKGKGSSSAVRAPHEVPLPGDDARSVAGLDIESGVSNVSGGVVRRKKRNFRPQGTSRTGANVDRTYRVAGGVQFNNIDEVFQDRISPEYAQEIIEETLREWGIDTATEPVANKYAEDLIFLFICAVSASDKGDWDRVFPLPDGPDGEREANMKVLSDALSRKHGVTRRQFSRGIADRIHAYLMEEANAHVLDDLAATVGCSREMAAFAFDGSTHCKAMNTRELEFTKTLADRNLFERYDEMAQGASSKLLANVSGFNAVRAVRSAQVSVTTGQSVCDCDAKFREMRHLVDFLSGYCSELSERLRCVESCVDSSSCPLPVMDSSVCDEPPADLGSRGVSGVSGGDPELGAQSEPVPCLKRARPLMEESLELSGKRQRLGTPLKRSRTISKRKYPCARCQARGLSCVSAPVCTECKRADVFCQTARPDCPSPTVTKGTRWSFMPGDDN